MSDTARITVTSGPDRGRVFELTGEMIRLGRSPENQVVFTDSQVGEQHASIVCREGRFAIHTLLAEGLEVDGTEVPPERWVWLPGSATIRIGKRTTVEFTSGEKVAEEGPIDLEPAKRLSGQSQPPGTRTGSSRQSVSISGQFAAATVNVPTGGAATGAAAAVKPAGTKGRRTIEATAPGSDVQPRPKKAAADRSEKKSRTLARFITDGPGDPLVKLGEDGHLPELTLHEAQSGEKKEAGAKESNSAMVLLVLGVSFGLTILMLFMDAGSFGGSQELKANARREIRAYWAVEGDAPLKPYQEHLREAQRAQSARDSASESREYRAVLSMLRSEAKDKLNKYTGLTGRIDYEPSSDNKKSDKRLEELIAILLSE